MADDAVRPKRLYEVRVPCKGFSLYYVKASTAAEAERMVWDSAEGIESDAPWINESGKPRARLLRARAAVESPDQPEDDMCPNCVTPWKCNGPHRAAPDQPEGQRLPHADIPGLTPETCPERENHGTPFRYCPVKGCGWHDGMPR